MQIATFNHLPFGDYFLEKWKKEIKKKKGFESLGRGIEPPKREGGKNRSLFGWVL